MKTAMDATGRVLIPSEIRRKASLARGTELEATWEDGRIVLEPRPLEIRIVRRGRFYVGTAKRPVPPMSSALIDSEIEQLRTAPRRGKARRRR